MPIKHDTSYHGFLKKAVTSRNVTVVHDHQHVIIFDGADMCGKTNIACELSSRTRIPYFKNSSERDAFSSDPSYFSVASRFIDTYIVDFLLTTKTSVIFDRNYPSEYVYPIVFKRRRDLDVLRKVDERHAELGTFIIVPYRTSFHGIVDDTHANITSDRLRLIDDLYIEFCEWSQCRCLRLNVDDNNIDREINDIKMFTGI